MNHAMSDVTMSHLSSAAKLFVVNENAGGVPVMVDFWNAGAVPDKLDYNMSSSSSTAVDAMNNNVQFLMQHPSGSSNEAGGDLRKVYAKVRQENSKGHIYMMFKKQLVGDADGLSSNSAAKSLMQHPSGSSKEVRGDPCKAKVSQDDSQEDQTMPLLSAAHPMYERPQVVDGPYAPIKPKKGQKGLDDFLPDDSEMARKAEYEDLKRRLEAAYRLRFDEVNRKGQEVTQDAYARMNQAYDLLQRRLKLTS